MSESIRAEKANLRHKICTVLGKLSDNDINQWSLQIASYVFALEEFLLSRTVMAFVSLPGEVDTWPILKQAWAEGKRVVVPRIKQTTRRWDASRVHEYGMPAIELEPSDADSPQKHPQLALSGLNIYEPKAGAVVKPSKIDLVLAPGLAFDRHGWRLGKGGGFYDRLLSSDGFRARVFGLAFSAQIVENVPHGPADKSIEGVVTEAGVLLTNQEG
ncbi:MAG: 5-formyltetrahydrofolate cyclo-ligase [Phycisphaerae bacterium]|nr:5-formyltetrahydrofolate cyclo-ligase [Phycisphaerae bacterium]